MHTKGHSTAMEAGAFAKEMNAKMLILNHLSNRYDYLDEDHYQGAVNAIQAVAMVCRKANNQRKGKNNS